MVCLLFPSQRVRIDPFADDLAVVVTAKYPEDVDIYAMKTLRAVKTWLERFGLTLTDAETEVV